jgi:hypothetical protein
MTTMLVTVGAIAFAVAFVGGIASDIYWKRHPNGYVYGIYGKRRRPRNIYI